MDIRQELNEIFGLSAKKIPGTTEKVKSISREVYNNCMKSKQNTPQERLRCLYRQIDVLEKGKKYCKHSMKPGECKKTLEAYKEKIFQNFRKSVVK
jgi:hypothetical protein